jgi:hypothetical protein
MSVSWNIILDEGGPRKVCYANVEKMDSGKCLLGLVLWANVKVVSSKTMLMGVIYMPLDVGESATCI